MEKRKTRRAIDPRALKKQITQERAKWELWALSPQRAGSGGICESVKK